MRSLLLTAIFTLALVSSQADGQSRIYRSTGGEIIFSSAEVDFNGVNVNTNLRFTVFFHLQQHFHFDLTNWLGVYTGLGIRNVGFIVEDRFQNVGFSGITSDHPNWNRDTKFKRRSYSIGVPLAIKIGSMDKLFIYGGGEYEWMFHYKQKLFLDGNKAKYRQWTSDRVNPWMPSLFAGVQFPGGVNLKFKYYLDDFLNTGFQGTDFGYDVDYSEFNSTGMWYISLAFMINHNQVKNMMGSGFDKSASLY